MCRVTGVFQDLEIGLRLQRGGSIVVRIVATRRAGTLGALDSDGPEVSGMNRGGLFIDQGTGAMRRLLANCRTGWEIQ
jgi:hypothetical protein